MTSSRCRLDLLIGAIALALPLLACGIDFEMPEIPNPDLPQLDEPDDEPPAKKPEKPKKPVKIDPGVDPKKKTPVQPLPGSKGGVIDFGTAFFPADETGKGVSYTFSVPPAARIAYALSDEEQDAVKDFYAKFAKSVQFKRTGDKTFQWVPPANCKPDMSCVYKKLIGRTDPDVAVITKRFKLYADQNKLSALRLADAMLAFVQNIPYQIPDEPFGLRPPPLVVAQKKGDCDSKALLLYMMLTEVGIDTVIISSHAHAHTMLGIGLPASGSSFRWKDRKYAFAETTAKGAPIGFLPPDVASPNDWKVEFGP